MTTACHIVRASYDPAELRRAVAGFLPDGDYRRICIKPNWVLHQEHDAFPIQALITSPLLIEAVIESCLVKYPSLQWIIVGDVPLQSCEWEKMAAQCGLDRLIRKYADRQNPTVRFLDLRRERFVKVQGYLEPDLAFRDGDPQGYREIVLDAASYLDPISDRKARFRVSDYDPGITTSSHREGFHRYVIAGSALEADLFINLPKMKTHQKAGITGALKNLVGINGQKACLVHHRKGSPSSGGDEFGPNAPFLVRTQVRVRELLQKRSRFLFAIGRKVWLVLKRLRGIHTEATRERLREGRIYMAAGSWYGNDTIWRMVYDLNRIIKYATARGGELSTKPQRSYLAIVDAIVSGEGNGPLQPLPVDTGVLIAGTDPLLVDSVMATLMGYDIVKIPCLAHHREFRDSDWGQFNPADVVIGLNDGLVRGLAGLPVLHAFIPPPGWRGHIEKAT